jgi:hypothetical protein
MLAGFVAGGWGFYTASLGVLVTLVSFKDPIRIAALLCLAFGAGVAAAIAPKDEFFMPNFLTFWGSQLFVRVPCGVRPRARGGLLALRWHWPFILPHSITGTCL